MIQGYQKRLAEIISNAGGDPSKFGVSVNKSLNNKIQQPFKISMLKESVAIHRDGHLLLRMSHEDYLALSVVMAGKLEGLKKTALQEHQKEFWTVVKAAVRQGINSEELGIQIEDTRRMGRVTYQNPRTKEIWLGVGRRPAWFDDLLNSGFDLSDLAMNQIST